jgi:cysteine desulfurase
MKKVYMDNAAATRLLPEAREAMLPFLGEDYGNPSSLHEWGDAAREALDAAREQVAGLINADPEEIYFTSGGTESNNFAVKGMALMQRAKGKHVVVSAIEHFSVLQAAETLKKLDFEVTEVPVDKYGVVDPADVKKAIRPDTVLVSIMHANGEIGTIQPVKEIAAVTQAAKVPFHTDAVATAGTIPVDVMDLGVNALSLAGMNFYGPKGTGALYVKKGTRIMTLLDGGIQEGGRRGGTENVAGIAGMGVAAEIAKRDMAARIKQVTPLRDRLLKELPPAVEHMVITGPSGKGRLPGHASFCTEFIEGEAQLMLMSSKGIAVSSGSACTSKALKASHVLLAIGLSHEIAQGSILFTMGPDNTAADIDYIVETMPPIVDRLRQMSPLYAKFQKSGKGGA